VLSPKSWLNHGRDSLPEIVAAERSHDGSFNNFGQGMIDFLLPGLVASRRPSDRS